MSTPATTRKKKGFGQSALDVVAATAPARTLGRGGFSAATAPSVGRGGFSVPTARSLGRGGFSASTARSLGSAAAATRPTNGGVGEDAVTAPSSIDGFLFPPSPSPAWFDADDKFRNQPHNFHLVGAPIYNSPLNRPLSNNDNDNEVEILFGQPDNDNDNVRTEKRIMWTAEEDLRLMSAWIEHSTDSTCGADKGGNQYWGEQCKDRWHKINRWTDLFECAYVKARNVFTSGYSDQMWIDAAHQFYVDNKEAKLGPFVLIEVWKTCREVSKWKTYNEELRNAHKRKSFHLEGSSQENDEIYDEMPKRPMGQKAAKKATLAAKGKLKGSSSEDDGNSKESAIDLDKLDRYSKFQEETNANRMKLLELQQKLSSEKPECTKIAHLTAQENKEGKKLEKESKMMETYNNLISLDTSSMSDVVKAERELAECAQELAVFSDCEQSFASCYLNVILHSFL
ncbi:hypothetical protein PVAP13_8KG314100 [Panicum virgatum]|uniref:No apical meristem-associated C-terminal domain-containing protein n=1 Tax=Panicum virgatum TaxID=38727 RepID=A0A8T0PP32_PANVG|nr:hypothetical protein PVAP13_8KG314100 [Panicum virgatum]